MMQMLSAIYSIASPVVLAWGLSTGSDESYKQAIDMLCESDAYVLVCDDVSLQTMLYMGEKLKSVQKISIFPVTANAALPATALANTLNSPRICLTAPAIKEADGYGLDLSAALLSAIISRTADFAGNLIGESVGQGFYLEDSLDNEEVEQYLKNGINVFEQNAGVVELIRGMTTATKGEDQTDDLTYRNISVILIQDTVLDALRQTLEGRLSMTRNNQEGLNSILSMIICRLDDFVHTQLIHAYDTPRVFLDQEDSTRCVVEVGFTITQGIQIIHLVAHISV